MNVRTLVKKYVVHYVPVILAAVAWGGAVDSNVWYNRHQTYRLRFWSTEMLNNSDVFVCKRDVLFISPIEVHFPFMEAMNTFDMEHAKCSKESCQNTSLHTCWDLPIDRQTSNRRYASFKEWLVKLQPSRLDDGTQRMG